MLNVYALFFLLLFVSPVLLGFVLPYVLWCVQTACRGEWDEVRKLLLIPLVALGGGVALVCAGIFIMPKYIESRFFDSWVWLRKPLFECSTEPSFNGDGYWFRVYALPQSIRRRFEAADTELLTQYPKKPFYRSEFKQEPWRRAPLDKSFEKYLNFALPESRSQDEEADKQLEVFFEEIRKALSGNDAYYGFFYSDLDDHDGSRSIWNIDFFIVDLAGGKVYVICNNF